MSKLENTEFNFDDAVADIMNGKSKCLTKINDIKVGPKIAI